MALKPDQRKSAITPDNLGQIPGDYSIAELVLTSPTRTKKLGAGSQVDLADNWMEINFYEDIYSPIVKGDITIIDAVGLIESFPILGEETLNVVMSSAGAKPTPTNVNLHGADIDPSEFPAINIGKFRVYKVDSPQKVTDNTQTIKMYFVSDTHITNMMIRVQKAYPTAELKSQAALQAATDKAYTVAAIVQDVYYDCFVSKTSNKRPVHHEPTKKTLLVEPTKGEVQCTIPNWTPFKTMTFLAGRALSANSKSNGSNFVFYETLKGFRFVSIETLMVGGFRGYSLEEDKKQINFSHFKKYGTESAARGANTAFIPVFDTKSFMSIEDKPNSVTGKKPYTAEYSFKPVNVAGQSELDRRYAVSDYSLIHSFDSVKNLGLGMFANRVITHDLVRMKIAKQDYFYHNPPDVIVTPQGQAQVETSNVDKPTSDQNMIIDNFTKAEVGKICSEDADFLGRPESHIMLYPTNSGISTKFARGVHNNILHHRDADKTKIIPTVEAQTVNGKDPSETPKEFEKRVEEWLGQRASQRMQNDAVRVHFTVPGDSAREVGDLIKFDFPTTDPASADKAGGKTGHKYYSGKFLITALRHKFVPEEYTMVVEAMKDGYKAEVTSGRAEVPAKIQEPDGTKFVVVSSAGAR